MRWGKSNITWAQRLTATKKTAAAVFIFASKGLMALVWKALKAIN
jgi:hypothetical protein